MTTPYDLLLAELRRDRSRPLITYYDLSLDPWNDRSRDLGFVIGNR
jgi:hypothetical protein